MECRSVHMVVLVWGLFHRVVTSVWTNELVGNSGDMFFSNSSTSSRASGIGVVVGRDSGKRSNSEQVLWYSFHLTASALVYGNGTFVVIAHG